MNCYTLRWKLIWSLHCRPIQVEVEKSDQKLPFMQEFGWVRQFFPLLFLTNILKFGHIGCFGHFHLGWSFVLPPKPLKNDMLFIDNFLILFIPIYQCRWQMLEFWPFSLSFSSLGLNGEPSKRSTTSMQKRNWEQQSPSLESWAPPTLSPPWLCKVLRFFLAALGALYFIPLLTDWFLALLETCRPRPRPRPITWPWTWPKWRYKITLSSQGWFISDLVIHFHFN